MSLNPEPADPVDREHYNLPPKTYAEAAEEALDADGEPIDIASIKESPPRPLTRNGSETRPLGEVIEQAPPGSPALRHPKGRIESKEHLETYAEAVKDHPPSSGALPNGNGAGMPAHTNQLPSEDKRNGSRRNGTVTPETFDGMGIDEEPRSPIRKAHKRISSRNLERQSSPKAQSQSESHQQSKTDHDKGKKTQSGNELKVQGVDGTPEEQLKPGALVYENVKNKSGENLASIKPFEGYDLSLEQTADKPNLEDKRRQRKDSDLVSGRRAGEGWARSAIRWAPLNVPVQRRLQTVMVLIHTLSIAGGLAIFLLLCAIPLLWPIVIPYMLYCMFSRASVNGKLSQRSEWFRRSKIWSLFASYFPARLHRSQELEPTRKYIFGYHPHGIISHGGFAAFATEALGFSQLFPGITNTLLTLDSNFRIPLYREYALRMGLASVSRESCENLLSKGGRNGEGMGRAITIVVGGARESLDAIPYTLRLVVKRRKGFVKLAIRQGADLVPVLAFGENDIYDQFDSAAHPWIHKGQMAVKKLMGFTVPLFHARGVFNYDVGMMPYRRPINIVVGRPVRILQNKNPDQAYIDEIHGKYVDELKRIWEDWKDTFARNRKGELEIVE
jgi:2-acylglycerol O-acyltransferase 2